jgi:hypothetical protein
MWEAKVLKHLWETIEFYKVITKKYEENLGCLRSQENCCKWEAIKFYIEKTKSMKRVESLGGGRS